MKTMVYQNRGLVVPFQHRNFTQRCTIIYINRAPAVFNHDVDFIDRPYVLRTSISDDDSLFQGQKMGIRTKPAL